MWRRDFEDRDVMPALGRDSAVRAWDFSIRGETEKRTHAQIGSKRRSKARRILIVNGHPDPRPERFCAALCGAYAAGARSGGWQAREFAIGTLAMSVTAPDDIARCCEYSPRLTGALEMAGWANRMTIVFPLWLDRPPELLHRFFHYLDLAQRDVASVAASTPSCDGNRSARIVVTMEMPAFAHRRLFRARGDLPDTVNALTLPGVRANELIFIGSVDTISREQRANWLGMLQKAGLSGS